ncbi:MAG TPA: hypothetical protein DCG66_05390 [Brevundimonas sp.]|uniref:hypothetical protein n=1 Tax=Brevundimonas aurantiaca TaxID=74316 RepID=UPI000EC0B764|nr:hypothetical protein [Brevundimonas sp.]
MLRLLRQICIGLTVTLMVAVQGFALRDAQHRLEHAVQFPGVDYVDVAVIASGPDHDHDHGHSHDEGGPVADFETAFDGATDGDEMPVVPHHHHSGGGEIHLALAGPAYPPSLQKTDGGALTPARDTLLAGTRPESPLDPPKQRA